MKSSKPIDPVLERYKQLWEEDARRKRFFLKINQSWLARTSGYKKSCNSLEYQRRVKSGYPKASWIEFSDDSEFS